MLVEMMAVRSVAMSVPLMVERMAGMKGGGLVVMMAEHLDNKVC
jgi:hypothetical protein